MLEIQSLSNPMKRSHLTLFCLATAEIIAACDNSTQSSLPAATATAPEPPPIPPSPPHQPINLKTQTLNAQGGLYGHDPERLIEALRRLNTEQDKYESDAKYNARMKSLGASPLYDDLTLASDIAFKPKNVTYKYDANKAQWTYEIFMHQIPYEFNKYLLHTKKTGNGETWALAYPGRKIEEFESIGIEVPELKGLSYIQGAVATPAEKARELDNQMEVLIVGKIVPSYYTSRKLLPIEFKDTKVETLHLMTVKITGVWLVQRTTGEVLTKKWTLKKY